MGQRLLAMDMLAHLHGRDAHDGVLVIRGGHHHGVDVLLGFEHLAEIPVQFGVRETLGIVVQRPLVHVAEGHNVLARDRPDVTIAHATDTDTCNVELFARRCLARSTENMARDYLKSDRGRGGGSQKASPCDAGSLRLRFHGRSYDASEHGKQARKRAGRVNVNGAVPNHETF